MSNKKKITKLNFEGMENAARKANIKDKPKPTRSKRTSNDDNTTQKPDVQHETPDEQSFIKGRPVRRTFTKSTAKSLLVFMPQEMKERLRKISFNSNIDQSELVRTAIDMFIKDYTDLATLTVGGELAVKKYIKETSI